MNIQSFTPPDRKLISGIPKDADWIDLYMAPVFEHIRLLTQAVQGNLSSENLNDDMKVVSVRHGIPIEVTTKIKGRPLGALLIAVPSPCILREAQPIDVGKIRLTIEFDDSSTDERQVTVLVKGA